MLATTSGRGPEELEGCEIWEELSSYKIRLSIGAAFGGASTGGATAGAGASQGCWRGGGAVEYGTRAGTGAEYCTGAGTAAEYCTGAGTAAEYCTGAEGCVVGSTVPIRRWGGATGARPAGVYCT